MIPLSLVLPLVSIVALLISYVALPKGVIQYGHNPGSSTTNRPQVGLEGTQRDAYSSKYSGLDDGFKSPIFEAVYTQISGSRTMNPMSSTETPYINDIKPDTFFSDHQDPIPIKDKLNIDNTITKSSPVVSTVIVTEYIHRTSTVTLTVPQPEKAKDSMTDLSQITNPVFSTVLLPKPPTIYSIFSKGWPTKELIKEILFGRGNPQLYDYQYQLYIKHMPNIDTKTSKRTLTVASTVAFTNYLDKTSTVTLTVPQPKMAKDFMAEKSKTIDSGFRTVFLPEPPIAYTPKFSKGLPKEDYTDTKDISLSRSKPRIYQDYPSDRANIYNVKNYRIGSTEVDLAIAIIAPRNLCITIGNTIFCSPTPEDYIDQSLQTLRYVIWILLTALNLFMAAIVYAVRADRLSTDSSTSSDSSYSSDNSFTQDTMDPNMSPGSSSEGSLTPRASLLMPNRIIHSPYLNPSDERPPASPMNVFSSDFAHEASSSGTSYSQVPKIEVQETPYRPPVREPLNPLSTSMISTIPQSTSETSGIPNPVESSTMAPFTILLHGALQPSIESSGDLDTNTPMSDITDLPSTIPDYHTSINTDTVMSRMVDTSISGPNLSPTNIPFPTSIVKPMIPTTESHVTSSASIPLSPAGGQIDTSNNFSLVTDSTVGILPLTEPNIPDVQGLHLPRGLIAKSDQEPTLVNTAADSHLIQFDSSRESREQRTSSTSSPKTSSGVISPKRSVVKGSTISSEDVIIEDDNIKPYSDKGSTQATQSLLESEEQKLHSSISSPKASSTASSPKGSVVMKSTVSSEGENITDVNSEPHSDKGSSPVTQSITESEEQKLHSIVSSPKVSSTANSPKGSVARESRISSDDKIVEDVKSEPHSDEGSPSVIQSRSDSEQQRPPPSVSSPKAESVKGSSSTS
ncbi:hypothetical protein CLU79DRAFT_840511 [Phycomyces nitens]|nr:hypothetical protein CLU79DRAFT_840511 [Phycomyces nitens]